jgi:hypothetical protein
MEIDAQDRLLLSLLARGDRPDDIALIMGVSARAVSLSILLLARKIGPMSLGTAIALHKKREKPFG